MVGFWCDPESTKRAPDAVYCCPPRPGNLASRGGYCPGPTRTAAVLDPRRGQGTRFALPALIARLDWRGRVPTGDALFCQRKLCEQVVQAGGDYLLIVKDNQPTLHADLRLLFAPPPLADRREAMSLDYGHGRHHEVRRLVASTDLKAYSDWPDLAQVWR